MDRAPGAAERLLRRHLYRGLACPRQNARRVDEEDGGQAPPPAAAKASGGRWSHEMSDIESTGGIFNLEYSPDGSVRSHPLPFLCFALVITRSHHNYPPFLDKKVLNESP